MTVWSYRFLRYDDGSIGLHEVYHDEAWNVIAFSEQAVGIVLDDDTNGALLDFLEKLTDAHLMQPLSYDELSKHVSAKPK